MSYTKHEEKTFSCSSQELFNAIKAAAAGLEGKIILEDPEAMQIHIQFHKTVHGKVLGDRTVLEVNVQEMGDQSQIGVEAYPVDVVGRKMTFGARKGVTQTVLGWFWAHIDHNLA